MSSQVADEYELNVNPIVCLIMAAIACLLYVFGSNDKKLSKRNPTDHMGKWDMMRIVWLLLKACIFFVLSTALTMIAFVCTVAYMRNKELTTFFEVHGLTVILGVQLVLYNVLNISVFLKIFRK
jgi:hypothetical protein